MVGNGFTESVQKVSTRLVSKSSTSKMESVHVCLKKRALSSWFMPIWPKTSRLLKRVVVLVLEKL